ncbi:MAG TPA: hypothetical protein VIU62_07650, partial [Chloroflexota bacterium]
MIHPAASSGLIALQLAAGTSTVALHFHDPPAARLGDIVSILALVTVLVLIAADLTLVVRRRANGAVPTMSGRVGDVAREPRPERAPTSGYPLRPWDPTYGIGRVTRLIPSKVRNWLPHYQRTSRLALVAVPIAAALLFAALGGRETTTGWQALDANLAGGLHLAGYALSNGSDGPAPEASAQPGQTVQLQVRATTGVGRQLAVQLTDAATTDWADWQAGVGTGTTAVSLTLPTALPPGLYELRLGSLTTGGIADYVPQDLGLVRLLPVDGSLLLGPLVVTAPARPPTVAVSSLARWQGQATLGNVKVPATVRAGTVLVPAWTWQVSAHPPGTRLTETIHLLDPAGHVLAAADTEPAGGSYPTPFWQPNELLRDRPLVRLAPDLPPGTYALAVGLRDSAGAIPAQDAAGRVVGDEATVGQVTVLPPVQTAKWDGRGITVGSLQVELARPMGQAVPGRTLTVTLRWHRPAGVPAVSTVTLRLRRDGKNLGSAAAPIGGKAYPATLWRPGETETQLIDLPVSGDAPAGPAELVIAAYENGSPPPAVTSLGPVSVAGRPHIYAAQPTTPTAITFANGIQLIGYDLRADGALWR